MAHPMQLGKRTRMCFARIEEALAVPDLIEVQKKSYEHFLKEGLREVLADVSPITDYSESLILEFTDYSLDDKPKYTVDKCKERDTTYAAPLKVTVRLTNRDTHEIKESEVFMGDFPLMTEHGTFIINGAERVIVSQLVRSPGVYYSKAIDKTGAALFSAQMIPNRGAWIEYETDSNGVVFARIDRARKLPVTVLLRAMGVESDEEITRLFGDDEHVTATITRDAPSVNDKGELRYKSRKDQALIEIYNKLRPGEPPSVDSATNLINSLFFDPKRYDLAHVGRYKYNKKLALALRLFNQVPTEDVVHPFTGEVLAKAGEAISREVAEAIQNAGVNMVGVKLDETETNIIGNNFAFFKPFMEGYDPELLKQYDESVIHFSERVHVPTLIKLLERVKEDGAPLNQALKEAAKDLMPKHVLVDDIIASVSYQFGLFHGIGEVDDIDHLSGQPPPAQRGRAAAEPDPRGHEPPGARGQGAHGHSGHRQGASPGPDQHPARVRRHQGVLRLLPAVSVHGPAQPAGRADPQAPPVGPGPRRSEPRARELRRARRALQPLQPHLPHRDA